MRAIWIGLFAVSLLAGSARGQDKASIPPGEFQPMFGSEGQMLGVKAFGLDRRAVTGAEFAAYLATHPRWRKASVSPALADANYLSQWAGIRHEQVPAAQRIRPVTNVSWFAASAYCQARGGRLPTTLEWEYVAAASKDKRDASKDPEFEAKILRWYSTHDETSAQQAAEPNFYGVHGLHGQIWEWTSDFNAFFVAADNRQDGDQAKNFFCGSGATGAANREGYAAFMRYALRSSLSANFSLNNLGFRCAYDLE